METKYRKVTFEEIRKNEEIRAYISMGNDCLGAIGYTEHGFAHAKRSSNYASGILQQLGYDDRTCELAAIAGYMHDIGNVINRVGHAQSGAAMAFTLLNKLEMDPKEIGLIVSAIGNHDESAAAPVNPIAAALILSDKGDVRRTRVRNIETVGTDIHDRVNYAVEHASNEIDLENRTIMLKITIDTSICPVMEYFEIFLDRMVLCRKAAAYLELSFELLINDVRLL